MIDLHTGGAKLKLVGVPGESLKEWRTLGFDGKRRAGVFHEQGDYAGVR